MNRTSARCKSDFRSFQVKDEKKKNRWEEKKIIFFYEKWIIFV